METLVITCAADLPGLRRWHRLQLKDAADSECLAAVTLAATEAATNSLRFAAASCVEIGLTVGGGFVWVDVRDQGPGLTAPRARRIRRAPLTATRGRGLYLMRHLMDVLEVRSSDTGSSVHMGRRLCTSAAGAR
jgi:anti-sigma regulatory factor (Ser/Thr protein kinase)